MLTVDQIERERLVLERLCAQHPVEMVYVDQICRQAQAAAALRETLNDLRSAISDFRGHGMPGFRDRATAYLVMQDADRLLAEMAPR